MVSRKIMVNSWVITKTKLFIWTRRMKWQNHRKHSKSNFENELCPTFGGYLLCKRCGTELSNGKTSVLTNQNDLSLSLKTWWGQYNFNNFSEFFFWLSWSFSEWLGFLFLSFRTSGYTNEPRKKLTGSKICEKASKNNSI